MKNVYKRLINRAISSGAPDKPGVIEGLLAISLEICHAVDVLHEAFVRHWTPEIINTDQGIQFTALE